MNRIFKIVLWMGVSLLGVISVLVPALQKGEPVSALWLVVAGVCAFAVSYRFYSAWLMAKVLVLDEERATPALTRNDGKDYVPTNKWVVFGHHFAAIAGPGPLVGPVLAAQFGFLPGTLWILIGATLGGGVHDAIILFGSMRRDGKSLGRMLQEEINPFIGLVALVSLLLIMTILLAVLGLVVVKALAHSPWGTFTIAMTIPLAMVMGLAIRTGKVGVGLVSAVGVIGLLACVAGGRMLPPEWKEMLTLTPVQLCWALMIYGLAASVLPVWLLLAPRDYLSTFMKLGTVAVLGLFIVMLNPQLHMPAVTKFVDGSGWVVPGPVFPFVCITIACGAVSGFHSLISSGTTPKLLKREKEIRMIGYGAMITEMLVALMALIAACALEPGTYLAINTPANVLDPVSVTAAVAKVNAAGFPVTEAGMADLARQMGEPSLIGKTGGAPTFAVGMAAMFARVMPGGGLDLWYHFAIMFEALFILTTLDAGTRVGRFILHDLLGHISPKLADTRSWGANVLSSTLLVAGWGYFMYQGAVDEGGIASSLWPIFGIANQLLAVIAFCLGTTLIIKMGRARYAWTTLGPLVVLTVVTFTAGLMKIFSDSPLGFLFRARAAEVAGKTREVLNNRVDAVVTGLFLLFVTVIVTGCAIEWVKLLRGRRAVELKESDYVSVAQVEGGV
ncbi:MAG: cstA [Verrucomicrobiales bacterium]|nr:cstA [Verrucomicrobiales bacterium]